ncbi:signal peptide peptidase SppA [Williamwhitmania taraxaci]|uniref:Protease-4 n=1 Tax=Williamwhitmania taraxaci TaxID=1640674 RepID=A0A1G6QWI4_9BACT|nr:signal peptide peptidase SppA [Williamwhitmania taraxaci]SDC96324.1 protease-4 [Williamwhitmania taraxaci]
MKSFFKTLLASILGVIIGSFLMLFLLLMIVGAVVSSGDKPYEVKAGSVLHLKFDRQIVDRASKNPFEGFSAFSMRPEKSMGLNEILSNIKKAKTDDNIKGIYLDLDIIPAGFATVQEIRNALIDFKTSKKFIVAYSDVFSQKAYFLASVSDKIYLNPEGELELLGLRSEVLFFKRALDKLGVEPQILRHGKFKSAVEPFMLDKMSPENREQQLTYMGSIWNEVAKGIAQERKLTVEGINAMANNLTIRNGKSAVDNGLIDSLFYKDQLVDQLCKLAGVSKEGDLKLVAYNDYTMSPESKTGKKFTKDKIAVIYASGEIGMGQGGNSTIGADGLSKAIADARKDSSVKAIVLRVNSPGGSALASEIIWRELVLAKKVKPLVVSMGDVAASGGYYISAPADVILANPTTITGSIGVFGLMFNAQKAMSDKLGITVDVAKTHAHADMLTVFRPLSAEERNVLQNGVEDIYKTFVNRVATGRNMADSKVDSIGGGRVWSGENAKGLGLVDQFGGLSDAILVAAKLAKLENYRLLELPKQKEALEALMEDFGGQAKMWIMKDELGDAFKHYNYLKSMLQKGGVVARMPYDVEIY